MRRQASATCRHLRLVEPVRHAPAAPTEMPAGAIRDAIHATPDPDLEAIFDELPVETQLWLQNRLHAELDLLAFEETL